jgi:putative transposase
MPSRNTVKTYVPEGVYHIYNRGVEKRVIFVDAHDYQVFLKYLKLYLLPPAQPGQTALSHTTERAMQSSDLWNRVELLAYCLMPNHFHFVLKQHDEDGMAEFMKRLGNAYVEYFNKRYERVGALFQSRYKAVLVENPQHFLQLSRYVHRNPLELLPSAQTPALADYPYFSYPEYLGMRKTDWLHSKVILDYFPATAKELPGEITYRDYVEDSSFDDPDSIKGKTLD